MTTGLLIVIYPLGIGVAKVAFDANAYVSLLKEVLNYTNVKDCWLCGTADQLDSPVLGIPVSNWTDLDPYSLHNTSNICRQGNVTMEETNFVLTLVNESVAFINYSTGGKNLGSFHKSSGNWSAIKLKLQHNFDVLRPDKYSEGVGTKQWADYLLGRETTNYTLAINASCNLPDGFWWLCGDLWARNQLPKNWTGECTTGILVPPLQLYYHTAQAGGVCTMINESCSIFVDHTG